MNENKFKGAWIFISHSSKDFAKVRRVRNKLEETGHKPILFFLKCFDDDFEAAFRLIKQEIDARDWFMLCSSENAKKSKPVQREVEYIKNKKGKIYEEIDLRDPWEKQKEKIDSLARRSTIFISSHSKDAPIARKIADRLKKEGFGVFYPDYSIEPGEDWMRRIESEIRYAVNKGIFLVLLSSDSIQFQWVKYEVNSALKLSIELDKSNIFPIIIKDREEVLNNFTFLRSMITPICDFTKKSLKVNMDNIIDYFKSKKVNF